MTDVDPAQALAQAGIEATPIRRAVFTALAGEGRAVSAGEVLAAVRRLRPANKVTVYRVLDLFVEKGLALRHVLEGRAFRYCLGAAHGSAFHCHVWCRRCGRLECATGAAVELGVAAFGQRRGLDVTGAEIRIDGICRDCRQAEEVPIPPPTSRISPPRS